MALVLPAATFGTTAAAFSGTASSELQRLGWVLWGAFATAMVCNMALDDLAKNSQR